MSQEKVQRTLESFGLTSYDSQIYIFLGKKGAKKGRDISSALKIPKNLLYKSLKNLQSKGIINASLERPAKFSAEPFEKVLNIFVNAKLEEVKEIETKKKEILSEWKSISIGIDPEMTGKFTVLEGKNSIYARLKNIVGETKRELLIISSVQGLLRAEQFGLLDAIKPKINVKFLTEFSSINSHALTDFLKKKRQFNFEGRIPELGLRLFTRIIIRDNEEATFFLSNDEQKYNQESDICLWTNCKSLVDSFTGVFENLWITSTDIEQKILQNKNDPITTASFLDLKEAELKYNNAIRSAQTEIVLIASTETLEYELKRGLLKEKALNGTIIKMLVPITGDNLETVGRLSEFCEIRHFPPSYVDTVIIDKLKLFQFKPNLDKNRSNKSHFENLVYIDEKKYLEKAQFMMKNAWDKAYSPIFIKPKKPTATTLDEGESILEQKRDKVYSQVFNFAIKPNIPESKILAQKELRSKILNAARQPTTKCKTKGITLYGSVAQAFIRHSEKIEFDDLMFQVFNNKQQSSFGSSITLLIYSKKISPQGFSFVPTVLITTKGGLANFLRMVHKGTILEKNIHVFKRGEIEVREQSNSLFVGWTKPIPLPEGSELPPSGLLFEGYGEVRTNVARISLSNGWHGLTEGNTLEAFTTFYYSSSKFSIPGTEGLFLIDHILTYIPPEA